MVTLALREWGFADPSLRLVGHTENTVFAFETRHGRFIARLSTPRFQTPLTVRGELRFIARCVKWGVPTSRPLPTRLGSALVLVPNLDPSVSTSAPRIVTLFTRVPGRHVSSRHVTEGLAFEWGATVARLHRATEGFVERRNARRPRWHEVAFQGRPLDSPLGAFPWFRREWARCEEWLGNLPEEEWGLIHADLHPGNFKVHRGRLHPFDFDDSFVGWRIYDLAVVWPCLRAASDEGLTQARRRALLSGYRSARPLGAAWERRIESFVRVRRVWMSAWHASRLDVPRLRNEYPELVKYLERRLSGELEL
jgi:Ser/Thr protein kinase RdoA (MazF antagonist)